MNASRDDLLFLHNKTPVSWASIDRWTYDEESSDGKPPPYTLYTGLDLKTFFVLFLVTNALHTLAIYIAKSLTSPTFKKDHFFIKVVHCLENTSVFLPHTDWDAEGGSVAVHKFRRATVMREALATFVINKVVGALMLLPLVFTSKLKY